VFLMGGRGQQEVIDVDDYIEQLVYDSLHESLEAGGGPRSPMGVVTH
jgi:hypothetical protein